MKIEEVYRQGDVLIMRVGTAPKHTKTVPRENGKVVLAHGEVTGHSHAIADKTVSLYEVEQTLDRLMRVKGKTPVALQHEEHGTIMIPPGDYIVRIQREYHPQELRQVKD